MKTLQLDAPVYALAFTPDGHLLAAYTWRGIHFLFPTPGQERLLITGPFGRGRKSPALRFSADGSVLIVDHHLLDLGPAPAWVRLGRGDSGVSVSLSPRETHFDPYYCLDFSPDGRLVVALGLAGLEMWEVNGRQARPLTYAAECCDLAVSPDGRMVATADATRCAATLRELAGGEELARLEHSNFVGRVAFSPDGRLLATATVHPSKVRLWEVASGRCVAEFKASRTHAVALAFHPHGRLLAAGDNTGTVRLWDSTGPREVARLNWQVGAISSLAFAPDGMTAAAGARQGCVVLWDLDDL
jgi:WD40 repeat protein